MPAEEASERGALLPRPTRYRSDRRTSLPRQRHQLPHHRLQQCGWMPQAAKARRLGSRSPEAPIVNSPSTPVDLPSLPQDGKALATGPPWFLAYPLFDGDSTAFGDFIRDRIHDLGGAWGEEIMGIRIGHPGQRDEVYERMRSAQRVGRDDEGVEEYETLARVRGGSRNHDLRETRELVRHFGLATADLPALVLQTLPAAPHPAVLRIRIEWLSSQGGQRTLSSALQAGLAPPNVRRLVEDGPVTVGELARRMQRLADSLHDDIRQILTGRARRPRDAQYDRDEEVARRRLVIETGTCSAFLDRQRLKLARQPFDILSQLAEAVSDGREWVLRNDLQDTVWQGNAITDSAMDSAIRRLRRALRIDGSLVETRRGVGYRLRLLATDVCVL